MILRMRDIAQPIEPLEPLTSVETALKLFKRSPDLAALPIMHGPQPVGVVLRSAFFEALALRPNQSGLNSIETLFAAHYPTPAISEASAPVASSAALILKTNPASLSRGVIVLSQGKYAGFALPGDLIKTLTDENMRRAVRMRELSEEIQLTEEALRLDASTKDARHQDFIANLGYELRTPLMAILGLADLIQDAKPNGPLRQHAQTISECSSHLHRLLDDLNDYARLGTHIEAPRAQGPVDLKALTAKLHRLWEPCAKAKSIELHIGLAKHIDRRIQSDETQIVQIANHLIWNALNQTRAGSIEIAFSTRKTETGIDLEIQVTDTGQSFPRQIRSDVFKPYLDTGQSNTGLGLSIVQKLATRMNGKAVYALNPKGGSVFTVTISAGRLGPHLAINNKTSIHPSGSKFKLGPVLLLEDHLPSRTLISESIEKAGWQVDSHGYDFDPDTLPQNANYQALIFNLRLSHPEKLDLFQKLKTLPALSNAVALALTADTVENRKQQALALGFDAILEKPIRPHALVTGLADAILAHKGAVYTSEQHALTA